ncbi:unnamed protein product [Coffea canephora]|uniref:DH200=94 genomic scaffold, scaffold_268 n=1 Tax=Coffea canephora TaxID=49390 RepID=A0A068VGA1_COFCA|nr:unnamed protein product [Coffea canephora]
MQENTTASPTPKQTQKSSKANEKGFSLFTLFKFADGVDIFLMVFGSICAIANGLAQPVMALLFGGVVDTFSTADYQHMPQDILRVSIKLLYLAAGAGIAAQMQEKKSILFFTFLFSFFSFFLLSFLLFFFFSFFPFLFFFFSTAPLLFPFSFFSFVRPPPLPTLLLSFSRAASALLAHPRSSSSSSRPSTLHQRRRPPQLSSLPRVPPGAAASPRARHTSAAPLSSAHLSPSKLQVARPSLAPPYHYCLPRAQDGRRPSLTPLHGHQRAPPPPLLFATSSTCRAPLSAHLLPRNSSPPARGQAVLPRPDSPPRTPPGAPSRAFLPTALHLVAATQGHSSSSYASPQSARANGSSSPANLSVQPCRHLLSISDRWRYLSSYYTWLLEKGLLHKCGSHAGPSQEKDRLLDYKACTLKHC